MIDAVSKRWRQFYDSVMNPAPTARPLRFEAEPEQDGFATVYESRPRKPLPVLRWSYRFECWVPQFLAVLNHTDGSIEWGRMRKPDTSEFRATLHHCDGSVEHLRVPMADMAKRAGIFEIPAGTTFRVNGDGW